MSKTYILSILIGLLIFMCIYLFYNKDIETFTGPSPAPAADISSLTDNLSNLLTTIGNGEVPSDFVYIEDLDEIPTRLPLFLYYTSFSEKTHYDNSQDVYIPSSQKWNDFITDNRQFSIAGPTVPITIKPSANNTGGLPMKNTRLTGISSTFLNTDNTQNSVGTAKLLSEFTATFFLKFNTITFNADGSPFKLFNISLENPNIVSVTIEQNTEDTANVYIGFQVGYVTEPAPTGGVNEDSKLLMSISKASLLSGICCITAVYSIDNTVTNGMINNIKIFINSTDQATSSPYKIGNDNKLGLGTSEILINSNSNIDANIIAFMYFKSALSFDDHKLLVNYLNRQHSGITNIFSTIKTLATNQLAVLKTLISDQSLTTATVQERLNSCIAEKEVQLAQNPPEFKYKINMDGTTNISTANLKQCSILEVDDRTTSNSDNNSDTDLSHSPSLSTGPSLSPAPAHSFPFNITIPFLRNITAKDYRS